MNSNMVAIKPPKQRCTRSNDPASHTVYSPVKKIGLITCQLKIHLQQKMLLHTGITVCNCCPHLVCHSSLIISLLPLLSFFLACLAFTVFLTFKIAQCVFSQPAKVFERQAFSCTSSPKLGMGISDKNPI